MTIAEILEKDTSDEFINRLLIDSESPYRYEFVQHMRDAAAMSHFKYGWVRDKPASHYKMLSGFERASKDDNAEHLVNIANYAMFQYMTDAPHKDYVNEALNAIDQYDPTKYVGTDSDKSVVRQKPRPVNEQLRERILSGPYQFFEPGGE